MVGVLDIILIMGWCSEESFVKCDNFKQIVECLYKEFVELNISTALQEFDEEM